MGLGPGWAPHFSQSSSPVCSRQVLPQEREVTGTLMTFFLALGRVPAGTAEELQGR